MALLLPETDYLKSLFEYRDGELYWRKSGKGRKLGVPAGAIYKGNRSSTDYRCIRIDGILYKYHRIVWKLLMGEEPEIIDHINRNGLDNRIENLRSGSHQDNAFNKENKPKIEKTRTGRYCSRITFKTKRYYQGIFDSKEEAMVASERKRNQLIEQHTTNVQE